MICLRICPAGAHVRSQSILTFRESEESSEASGFFLSLALKKSWRFKQIPLNGTFVKQLLSVRYCAGHMELLLLLLLFSRQVVSDSFFCDPMNYSMPGFPVIHYLLEFLLTLCPLSLMPSNHLILCHLLPPFPSIFPSIRVFSNKSTLPIRWPKNWSLSFSISPSNEYSGLISFRIDWFDVFGVHGTLKSLLQYHSSKASILCHSAFFMAQLSHSYMATRKTVALTIRTVAGKVMSLPFHMLSRFVIDFLPRNKCFLFFNYMAAVTIHSNFGAQENEIWHLFPSYLPLSDGIGCHDLSFLNVQF